MAVSGLSPSNLANQTQIAAAAPTVREELSVEEYVDKYFSDIPVLKEVAKCESQLRQVDERGNVLRGVVNSFDRGVMQINLSYHKDRSENLGYDINELSGNVAYARHLFEAEGLRPWNSSAPCWRKSQAYKDYVRAQELALR
jgi:hypothetical protein